MFAKQGPSHRTQHSDPPPPHAHTRHCGRGTTQSLPHTWTRRSPGRRFCSAGLTGEETEAELSQTHPNHKVKSQPGPKSALNSSLSLTRIQEVFQVPMTIFWKPIVEALTLSWLIRKRPEFCLSLITTTCGRVVKKICNPHWEYIL